MVWWRFWSEILVEQVGWICWSQIWGWLRAEMDGSFFLRGRDFGSWDVVFLLES